MQDATTTVFQAVSRFAGEAPIVVVPTKKDEFLDISFQRRLRELRRQGHNFNEQLENECDQHAQVLLQERVREMEGELLGVPGGRFHACIPVSHGALIEAATSLEPY
jgi:GTPase SAR1 family protein